MTTEGSTISKQADSDLWNFSLNSFVDSPSSSPNAVCNINSASKTQRNFDFISIILEIDLVVIKSIVSFNVMIYFYVE